jgi:hypothetical protein
MGRREPVELGLGTKQLQGLRRERVDRPAGVRLDVHCHARQQHPAARNASGYMGVSVTGVVTKDGRDIAGDIEHIVIVETDSSYGPDLGHEGVGQVVASVC